MSNSEQIAGHFLKALAAAAAPTEPYRHWPLCEALPRETAQAIAALPFAPPAIGDTLGKRETHNSTRIFFSAENRRDYPVCAAVAGAFQSAAVVEALQARTGADLSGSFLRIEYCQDTDGFWLEPHTDIGAKLFTMLIYLSDTPEAKGWGTDLYDAEGRHLGAADGSFDRGLIFIPGRDTWHGVAKRTFAGVRKSIIVNFVKPEWRSRHELAFAEAPVA
ncbi:MAG: 2OG-Fe(II) oxygenase [Alphaproteobacteria bacterium]|nr:2OG-Fe(II) oxygenase [Alphaproteobacteria bacterium]